MKGKHDPGQPKMTSCPSDPSSFVPDQEFVELIWENGQILMQSQSDRQKKSSTPSAFPGSFGNAQEKEDGDAVALKSGRQGVMGSATKDFQMTGPLGQTGLNGQDVEITPWPNYPIDDYYSEFLCEFSGVNLNSLSTAVPADRIISYGQATRGTHVAENGKGTRDVAGCLEPNGMMNSQLIQLLPQCQSSTPRNQAKESDFRTSVIPQGSSSDLHTTKMQTQDQTSSKMMQPNGSMGLTNFSHFSRPVALVKANLQSFDRVRSNEKTSTTVGSSPLESALFEPVSGLKSVSGFQGQLNSVRAKADLKSSAQPLEEMISVEHSNAVLQEDAAENSRNCNKNNTASNRRSQDHMQCHISSFTDNIAVVKCEADKRPELVVASPSLCSGNGAAAASNDVKNRGKRKNQECEESEYQSEDLDDDSADVKKTVPVRGTGTKRSRAAEVHNLSERRRRDRINEKMRALQELIPNCNKVDKASVLDEAIEYLKSLQMQVQIMSMGGGLCMPPMILPTGVRAAHVGPFAPMGMGMGMGMGLGFGMGMLDMTGSPLIPVPPMHGPQYPCPTIPGAAGLHGMPGFNGVQMFGMPGQASPMSMPRPPPFIPLTGMSMQANPLTEAPRAEVCPVQVTKSYPQSSKEQLLQTIEPVAKSIAENSQANKACIEEPSVVHADNKLSNVWQ